MKKRAFIILAVALCGAGGFAGFALMQEPTVSEGVTLEGMKLGKLTKEQALTQLQKWWESKKSATIRPVSKFLKTQPNVLTLEQVGVKPDWNATFSNIPFDSYLDKMLGRTQEKTEVQIVWSSSPADFKQLIQFVRSNSSAKRPASIKYVGGRIIREEEIPGFALDESKIGTAALEAIRASQKEFEIPMIQDKPRVSMEDLNQITEVVSSYTTRFNSGATNRASNVRLATSKINGVILLPGETFSYNNTVGERSIENGYKMAPIYVNGKHEMGEGGGACQVSTTLYNAALFANLKIVQRQNHSMPVAYVPRGRDATVSWGSIDLKFTNTYDNPIAIVSSSTADTITFTVLGKKDKSLSIDLITTNHSSWGNDVKYVLDPSLGPGKEKVVEKGSGGYRCVTWRIIKKGGVEVKRENLGVSYYRPSTRIVARGPAPAAPLEGTNPEGTPPSEIPPIVPAPTPPPSDGG